MIVSFINIRKVPREMLKTSGFALGFQHLPQDLVNVNEWKIMFDPYILESHGKWPNDSIQAYQRLLDSMTNRLHNKLPCHVCINIRLHIF